MCVDCTFSARSCSDSSSSRLFGCHLRRLSVHVQFSSASTYKMCALSKLPPAHKQYVHPAPPSVPVPLHVQAVPDLAEFVHIATLSSGWVSGLALTAVFLPLPLQLHALLCLAAALVIPPNAAATCSKPCMANPVSAARADAWLRLLQRLAILRPVRQQLAGLGPFSACRALLVANHYVWGILLPTLLVVEMQQAAGRRLWRYLLGWQGWGAPAGGSRVTWLAVANRLLLYVCVGQLLVAGVLYYFATFGEQGEPAS